MKNPIFLNPSDPLRIDRGGNWDDLAWDARVSFCYWNYASDRDSILGFRLFRTKEKS